VGLEIKEEFDPWPSGPFKMFDRFACSIGFASTGLVQWFLCLWLIMSTS
jgi:hypothetical protein